MFRKWGVIRLRNLEFRLIEYVSSRSCRGAAFDRSRLNAASENWTQISSNYFGLTEVMDSRQYRHTQVSGTIDLAPAGPPSRKHRATREMISGGNLLTGCSFFRKGRNLRILMGVDQGADSLVIPPKRQKLQEKEGFLVTWNVPGRGSHLTGGGGPGWGGHE